MKQGTNFKMNVQFGIDLSLVDSIEFKFKQGDRFLLYHFPSESAYLTDNNQKVQLVWTYEDTFLFKAGNLRLDTLIKLKDTEDNPQTEIIYVRFDPTLFTLEDY